MRPLKGSLAASFFDQRRVGLRRTQGKRSLSQTNNQLAAKAASNATANPGPLIVGGEIPTTLSEDAYVLLENYRDICCLNFEKVLSLLYTHPGLRMALISLRKASVFWQMIAHDYPIEQSNGRVASNAQTSGWHFDFGKARFRTSLATTPWREVGLQEIC